MEMAGHVASSVRTDAPPAIVLDKVNKWFGALHVLRDVDLQVALGERVVVCGPSGSGKSTMIRCINRLETHQEGKILVDGIELSDDVRALDAIRREVGMVFQSFNLFPHLSVLENCTLAPIWVRKMPKKDAEELAMEYLTRVKIPEQAKKYPGQLSGGQQQRVAIARALMQGPQVVLADEPIASLDPLNAKIVMDALRDINERDGITVVTNLHTLDTARNYCSRIIGMAQGRVVFDGTPEQLTAETVQEIYGADSHGAGIDESMTSTSIRIPSTAAAAGAPASPGFRTLAVAEA